VQAANCFDEVADYPYMIADTTQNDDVEMQRMDATDNEAVMGGYSNGNNFIHGSGSNNLMFIVCYDFGTRSERWKKTAAK